MIQLGVGLGVVRLLDGGWWGGPVRCSNDRCSWRRKPLHLLIGRLKLCCFIACYMISAAYLITIDPIR